MESLEHETNNQASGSGVHDSLGMSTVIRHKLASFLADIPEPATQTAALQLIKNSWSLDKSLAYAMWIVGLAILEEMI
jgi:hypothetical protein